VLQSANIHQSVTSPAAAQELQQHEHLQLWIYNVFHQMFFRQLVMYVPVAETMLRQQARPLLNFAAFARLPTASDQQLTDSRS